jgi:hypothetical protein
VVGDGEKRVNAPQLLKSNLRPASAWLEESIREQGCVTMLRVLRRLASSPVVELNL